MTRAVRSFGAAVGAATADCFVAVVALSEGSAGAVGSGAARAVLAATRDADAGHSATGTGASAAHIQNVAIRVPDNASNTIAQTIINIARDGHVRLCVRLVRLTAGEVVRVMTGSVLAPVSMPGVGAGSVADSGANSASQS